MGFSSTSSPHLALVLDQLAKSGNLEESVVKDILGDFEQAINKDGAVEIGFTREVGQSFNPRAARILLILLKDARIRDVELLSLAANRAGIGGNYDSYVRLEEPLVVTAAFLLDRLRHLHLEKNPESVTIYQACLKAGELVSIDFPQLSLLLEKGVERMKRNIK